MSEYRCEVCKAMFDTTDPKEQAACPSCGEFIKEREVPYTDRQGGFTIGGKVSQLTRVYPL